MRSRLCWQVIDVTRLMTIYSSACVILACAIASDKTIIRHNRSDMKSWQTYSLTGKGVS